MDAVEQVEQAMVAIRRRQSRRALARLGGVTGQVFDILDAIEGGGPATVTSVAQALGVDQPRASKLVAAAVETGWVCRQADQGDGRRSVLVLTEAGQAAVEQAHRSRQAVFAEAMTAWREEERTEFARLLARFVKGLPG
ncbi:MarR family winged helix-turn-helix transcriptional regulator [Nonomuraea cavernae]|nr:MarR family winged helix-turn-helix transcriptional regulator [Nonomuraea cavernae]MCA2184749.1 MarR family winged helix-turn-helix transcriptional regulator [Nonomuraea cavernae]